MGMGSLKKKKRRNRNNLEDIYNKDRSLSELPDHLLSHILSFLHTEEAVRTSILSKRWEFIWTSIPELHFSTKTWGDLTNFIYTVDRSLHLHGSIDITSFSLYCDPIDSFPEYEDSDVKSKVEEWISDVVRFNVQHVKLDLTLDLPPDAALILPSNFVNCTTLTSLTIDLPDYLEFPSSVCFSNLRKLGLINVTFANEHSPQRLFSGCPMLEDLKLERCDWGDVKATVSVVSPRLRCFTMIKDQLHDLGDGQGHEFVIFSGCLKYFHYEGEFLSGLNILNSRLLEEVHMNFYLPPDYDMILFKDRFFKLLSYASDVPILRLMNAWCVDFPQVMIDMPMFNGVRRLELDYGSSDLSNRNLLKALQNMPCLESLVFLKGIKRPSDPIEDNILNPLPPCFLNHLHFVSILIENGSVRELMGVKDLLKKAMVLKEMAIEFCNFIDEVKRNNFCTELLKLPRDSRDCGIFLKKWKL